jgi:hypothetical protein
MVTLNKLRNEDLSIYFFVKDTLSTRVQKLVDGYPYTEIENGTLVVPSASIEHRQTTEEGGELGSSWFRRNWAVDIFAVNDGQRDELSGMIFDALDVSIPVRDYSSGFRAETGKSLLGTDLTIIEYISPEDRMIRPTYGFDFYAKLKFWRATVTFTTVSTQRN